MCGFAGFSDPERDALGFLQRMVRTISHRGPDDRGFFLCPDCAFGFCRLSILDLRKEGNQPMHNEDKTIHLICNGEIYNYRTLRASLEAKGHRFQSQSDAEVILHGYESYGQDILQRLRGMFCFVLYDEARRLFFGANDLFGIKPFYYALHANRFFFASEAKALFCHPAIEKRLQPRALLPYLSFQYSPCDETFFDGVKKLPPAHAFVYQNGQLSLHPYADRSFSCDDSSFEVRIQKLRDVMASSVALHAQSDVPIGAFLSGGVDSGYLCALLRPRHTFSVGFTDDARFDETPLATALAQRLGCEHHNRILTSEECFDALCDIQYHLDEPSANPSCVPLWFLCREARQYVTVVLSGEGADELFGGYDAYGERRFSQLYKTLPKPVRCGVAKTVSHLPYFRGQEFLAQSNSTPSSYYIGQAKIFSPAEAKEILQKDFWDAPTPSDITKPFFATFSAYDELTQKQALDLSLWLPRDILQKADKMSMASSLELRVPYLDREVFELARRLRTEEKLQRDLRKAVLRYAAREHLTKEEAFRQKKGFPVPIRFWLREARYYDRVAQEFSSANASLFFRKDALFALLDDHYHKRANVQRKIWCIYCFLLWCRRFFS